MEKFILSGILLCVLYVATCEARAQLNQAKNYILSIEYRNSQLRVEFVNEKFEGNERTSQDIVIDGMNHLKGNLSMLDNHNANYSNILDYEAELYILHYNVLQTFNRSYLELLDELADSNLLHLANDIHYDIEIVSTRLKDLVESMNMTVSDTHPPVRLSRSVHDNPCVGECIHEQLLYIIDKLDYYILRAKNNLWLIAEKLNDV